MPMAASGWTCPTTTGQASTFAKRRKRATACSSATAAFGQRSTRVSSIKDTRKQRCVRDLRIAIEPRLQRDVEDRLWDDDPNNWLETELRLPRSSSGMVYDEQSGDLVMPTLLITIDNTDAANPVVDVVQAERRTAANY